MPTMFQEKILMRPLLNSPSEVLQLDHLHLIKVESTDKGARFCTDPAAPIRSYWMHAIWVQTRTVFLAAALNGKCLVCTQAYINK